MDNPTTTVTNWTTPPPPSAGSLLLTRQFQLNAVEETRRKHLEALELQNQYLKENLEIMKRNTTMLEALHGMIALKASRENDEKENIPPSSLPKKTRRSSRLAKKAKKRYQ